jgi:hypothetical protein
MRDRRGRGREGEREQETMYFEVKRGVGREGWEGVGHGVRGWPVCG